MDGSTCWINAMIFLGGYYAPPAIALVRSTIYGLASCGPRPQLLSFHTLSCSLSPSKLRLHLRRFSVSSAPSASCYGLNTPSLRLLHAGEGSLAVFCPGSALFAFAKPGGVQRTSATTCRIFGAYHLTSSTCSTSTVHCSSHMLSPWAS